MSTIDAKDEKVQNKSDADPQEKKGLDQAQELGGRKGPEPTRYGDWELNGKCVDF
jgi:hypothetical protein